MLVFALFLYGAVLTLACFVQCSVPKPEPDVIQHSCQLSRDLTDLKACMSRDPGITLFCMLQWDSYRYGTLALKLRRNHSLKLLP